MREKRIQNLFLGPEPQPEKARGELRVNILLETTPRHKQAFLGAEFSHGAQQLVRRRPRETINAR
jgi:hypothetical protein